MVYATVVSWAWLAACIVATTIVLFGAFDSLYRPVLLCDLLALLFTAVYVASLFRQSKPAEPEIAPMPPA